MDRQSLRNLLFDLLEEETWVTRDTLSDDSDLRTELKLDSVDLLSVALQAERKLGISIEASDFGEVKTLGNLLDLLMVKLEAKPVAKAA
jgi:acyl carrier protein